jgi:hypothetical protein
VGLVLIGWYVASASVAMEYGRFALDYGSDFAGEEWRRSPTLDRARTDGASHPLYTNWPAAVYFHLHRPSYSLPTPEDGTALADFVDMLRRRDGRVLVFDAVNADDVVPRSLIERPDLRVIARTSDGVMLAPVSGR